MVPSMLKADSMDKYPRVLSRAGHGQAAVQVGRALSPSKSLQQFMAVGDYVPKVCLTDTLAVFCT